MPRVVKDIFQWARDIHAAVWIVALLVGCLITWAYSVFPTKEDFYKQEIRRLQDKSAAGAAP